MYIENIKFLLNVVEKKKDGLIFGTLIFPNSVIGNHLSMSKLFRLKVYEAGFLQFSKEQYIPFGSSTTLKLSAGKSSESFFSNPDFYVNVKNPINLYFHELDNYYFIASSSIVDKINKGEFRLIEQVTNDPEKYYQLLVYKRFNPKRKFLDI